MLVLSSRSIKMPIPAIAIPDHGLRLQVEIQPKETPTTILQRRRAASWLRIEGCRKWVHSP